MVRSLRVVAQTDLERLVDVARLLADARRVVLIGGISARRIIDYASCIADMSLTG